MNIELINTGSELLLGRVLNTHQQWLGRRLSDLGHTVRRQMAVADDAAAIQQAVREALDRADLVVTTGGLGPTSDDLTRQLIAELLGRKLVENEAVRAHIENQFSSRGWARPAMTRVENFVPEGALVFLNAFGTAPGLAMWIGDREWRLASGENQVRRPSAPNPRTQNPEPKCLIMLPGPPRELQPMFDDQVAPFLQRELPGEKFVCRTLRTTGVGEAHTQEMVAAALAPLVARGLGVGYCARPGAVDVRLSAGGVDAEKVVREAKAVAQKIFGASIYGFDDDEIEAVVVKAFIARKKTLALAESCTGGNLAHRVTNVSGASGMFLGGMVSYANSVKEKFLGVRAETLAAHGAVSETVAREMALGARAQFGADFALAVTGIAGPGGGSPEKPVGTVFIALASATGVAVKRFFNVCERETFKQVTATQALNWLRLAVSA